jgi:hypothetical protein
LTPEILTAGEKAARRRVVVHSGGRLYCLEAQMRDQFLMEMYKTAWANITRMDDLVWKVFISYATVVVGATVLSDKLLKNVAAGLAISMVLTAVATAVSFNVNLWFLRNLVIISNVEATFLAPEDYGHIIPRRWHPPFQGPFFNWKELYPAVAITYSVFAAVLVVPYIPSLATCELVVLSILAAALAAVVYWYLYHLKDRFEKIRMGAPGPSAPSSTASPPTG